MTIVDFGFGRDSSFLADKMDAPTAAGFGLLRFISAALKVDDLKRRFSVKIHHPDHLQETQKLGKIPAVQSLRRVVSCFEIEVGAILF